eukprot:5777567-Amphidinium_carterae.1
MPQPQGVPIVLQVFVTMLAILVASLYWTLSDTGFLRAVGLPHHPCLEWRGGVATQDHCNPRQDHD